MKWNFYAPGGGPPGASSNRMVCPSVRPSVCGLFVIPSRLQTKSNNYNLDEDRVTKLGLFLTLH